MKTGISPALYARLQREARAMGLTVEALVERALFALADEIDTQRQAARIRPRGKSVTSVLIDGVSHGQGRLAEGR